MLISEEYRSQLQEAHEQEDWGTSSPMFADLISNIANQTGAGEILDYGCGKAHLGKHLKLDHPARVFLYDPAIEKFSKTPDPRDMVVCTDVLEHIEPDLLDDVLDDLQRVTKSVGFFNVCTLPAIKILPDGRNAHLIQEPMEWWLPKLMERFAIKSLADTGVGFWLVVSNKEIKDGH